MKHPKKYCYILALMLLNSAVSAEDFPFAKGTFIDAKLTTWTLEMVHNHRDSAIGKLEGLNSVPEKDNAGKTAFLAYPSDHPNDVKTFTTELDLTDHSGLVFVAIQVDDLALLTVEEKLTGNEPSGHISFKEPYRVDGTALWRVDRSYKEFPIPIIGGRKYDLTLKYENTANLTKKYDGLIDYDGVNVFLMHHPAVDLDVDSNNTEGFDFTWGSEPEDKIEVSPSLPGKIIAVPIEPDADNDGIPDYKDFGGITPGPDKQFVQMVVHLPPNYDPETATVTFDYPMSATAGISATSPPKSGFRIWTKNGHVSRSLDAIPVAPPAAPDPAPGYLVKDEDPILWKNLAANCEQAEAGRYPGPAIILYLETVITYTGGSLSKTQPEQIKVTAKNGSTSDELETEDVVNITVRCTGGVQLSGVKALLVNDDDDNGDGVSDKDNDRLGFVDDDVQPIRVTATALDQAIKVTIDSNKLYTTVGPTPSGSGGLIDGVYPGKRLTNGVASGSDAEGQSKIGWKEGIYTIEVPANSTIVQNLYIEGLRESAAIDDVVIDAVILTPSVPAGKKLAQATTTASHKLAVIGADIVPDSGQPGTTGDLIASNKGASGEKHYVSPKKSAEITNDFVVLKAEDITKELFEQVLEWECAPAANGSVDPNDSTKFRVKRDAAGKTVVKLKTKDGGLEIDLMNVWIIWTTMQAQMAQAPIAIYFNDLNATQIKAQWNFTATIEPQTIFQKTSDIPDMTGVNETDVPNHDAAHAFDGSPFGDARYKWDISRRWRERDFIPTLKGKDLGWPVAGIMNATIPDADIIQKTSPNPGADHYPTNIIEGNDDLGLDKDPYTTNGVLSDIDTIANPMSNGAGAVGDTVEMRSHFVEFVRVEINKKWYLLSDGDMGDWRLHIIAEKKDEAVDNQDFNGDGDKDDEVWVDAGSVSDATNNGF